MRFDARAAKALKPDEHLTVDGCPGLRLVASESRKTWIYRYRRLADNKLRQVKIGEWPAMSPAAAAGKWEELRTARDEGRDPAGEKRQTRSEQAETAASLSHNPAYTVRRLVDDYLEGHIDKHRKTKGAVETRRTFDKMLGDFASLPVEAVTRSNAFDLIQSHSHIPVQASKLRLELGAAWDFALDAGRLPDNTPNWWRQIMRGRLRSKGKKINGESIGPAKRVLSEVETGALIRWLPNFTRNVCDVLTLYLWTGLRGSEIVLIEKHEVTEEDDGLWWTIPKAKTKNARHPDATDHRVPLVGRAEDIVRRRMEVVESGYLIRAVSPRGKEGKHMEQKVVQTAVYFHQPYSVTRPEVDRPRLPVTHWAPHDLRRTVRTMLASMDCPGEIAEVIIGHMLPGVQGVYNRHKYDRQRREWLTKLSEKLETLAATR